MNTIFHRRLILALTCILFIGVLALAAFWQIQKRAGALYPQLREPWVITGAVPHPKLESSPKESEEWRLYRVDYNLTPNPLQVKATMVKEAYTSTITPNLIVHADVSPQAVAQAAKKYMDIEIGKREDPSVIRQNSVSLSPGASPLTAAESGDAASSSSGLKPWTVLNSYASDTWLERSGKAALWSETSFIKEVTWESVQPGGLSGCWVSLTLGPPLKRSAQTAETF